MGLISCRGENTPIGMYPEGLERSIGYTTPTFFGKFCVNETFRVDWNVDVM